MKVASQLGFRNISGRRLDIFESDVTQGSNTENPVIQLMSIPVVSNLDLSWEIVGAFREDDLMTRIEDHQEAAKKWGLKTLSSTLSVGASEKLLAATAGGLVAAIAGASVPLAR